MNYKNQEGYSDPTAYHAIRHVDEQPDAVRRLITAYKQLASLLGYEIVGRITLKDRESGKEYK